MTEHIYPAFERGRIMKKELLWALRDYSYTALQLQYAGYPDGILAGCHIRTDEQCLYIAPGLIKCQDFLFLIAEEEKLPYFSADYYVSLKFCLLKKEALPDYISYITEFRLDKELEQEQNELELCRFKLKKGARLRTDYNDFFDIQTEYDTVNLADAAWSAAGGNTLSKEITDYFARKVLECERAETGDIQFAYFLLQSKEAVNYEILMDYIRRKTGFSGERFLLEKDNLLRDSINEKYGVRILNQEFHEMLISFIISQNKQIPHIKQLVRRISEEYGEYLGEINGEKYYSFPEVEILGTITEEQFREMKTGFRAPYLADAVEKLSKNVISVVDFQGMDEDDARKKLMEIKGVGEKVANCVMLFGLGYRSAFPIDVWMKRIMETLYFQGKDTKKELIADFAKEMYGEYGGYAQQYLFCYGRDNNVGK